MEKKNKRDALLGALDLLILRVISTTPLHGYGISRRIEQVSGEVLSVQEGSLYPALARLEKKSFIKAEWQSEGSKRPLRMYSLTEAGEQQLKEEQSHWELVSAAVNVVLRDA